MTVSNKVYGFGKKSHGQLGRKWVKKESTGPKFESVPVQIDIPTSGRINRVVCGSLFSTALVSDE